MLGASTDRRAALVGWSFGLIPVLISLPILTALSAAPVLAQAETGMSGVSCASESLAATADSVAAAFIDHQFVFLGSTHGHKKQQDFLLCLLSRPSFQGRVTNVLVEWASPVHQRLADQYLLSLESVSLEALSAVWFDTADASLWAGMPLIRDFYVAVRDGNRMLDATSRIRVLGGNEPVDWTAVENADQLANYPFKNNWAAHLIVDHLAAMPDPVLVVYGDQHIHHGGGLMMSSLESALGRDRLFVVGTIPSSSDGDPGPISRMGDPSSPFFVRSEALPDSGPYPDALFYASQGPLSDYVDAVLYLGPEPDPNLESSLPLNEGQRSELQRREALEGDPFASMELRLSRRDSWFSTHPADFPARP